MKWPAPGDPSRSAPPAAFQHVHARGVQRIALGRWLLSRRGVVDGRLGSVRGNVRVLGSIGHGRCAEIGRRVRRERTAGHEPRQTGFRVRQGQGKQTECRQGQEGLRRDSISRDKRSGEQSEQRNKRQGAKTETTATKDVRGRWLDRWPWGSVGPFVRPPPPASDLKTALAQIAATGRSSPDVSRIHPAAP
jgi:hypothetical protein